MVLTDLKQQGIEDLLITCVDGLKGFDTAINGVFPQATVQLCIVHQLRNSFRFIPDKYLKDFVKDIKTVYQTSTAEQGWENLLLVQEQWGKSVSAGGSRLDGQLGVVIGFFRVPNRCSQSDVHNQYGGRLSSGVTQSDQNKRSL